MNRVVKTALAVTAFGLAAAAMAVPAQAEVQYNTARYAPIDGLGGGTIAGADPLGGLLSSLIGGGGGLLGALGGTAKSGAQQGGQMSELERDMASENQAETGTTANAHEDVTAHSGPIPELSPILSGLTSGVPLGGGGLTESLPVLGAARMAQPATPSVKAGKQGKDAPASQGDVLGSGVTGTVGSSVERTVNTLSGASLLPASSSGAVAKTMAGGSSGLGTFSADALLGGVTEATWLALPHGAGRRLAPALGQVTPAEMAPVVEALPATSQAAAMDELAPLVQDTSAFVEGRGVQAAGAYSDLITALGWTTDALTSSVRGSAVRD
ncbi:hypothetical protein [Nonomuraea gerenzanensis]|uniref:Uncharacterized protein n=1 Tax=Nonomuraea gerenzanensis TaxID=93944 RepID=A0A1M4ERB6_9ACTN|nr:hypothetical protein [Nonomuraea gerenzanensis]UBU12830.1 hypothetical protein LCN96_52670 [Nonomuraea gerenzanensis]SBP01389.1 PREDICTED: hypothetical protein [Nonomuraea gerenzanensis]